MHGSRRLPGGAASITLSFRTPSRGICGVAQESQTVHSPSWCRSALSSRVFSKRDGELFVLSLNVTRCSDLPQVGSNEDTQHRLGFALAFSTARRGKHPSTATGLVRCAILTPAQRALRPPPPAYRRPVTERAQKPSASWCTVRKATCWSSSTSRLLMHLGRTTSTS